MTRIAAYLAGIAAIAGVLCLPALWSSVSTQQASAGGPWPDRWDDVLGTSVALLVVVVLAGLIGAVVAGRLGARAGEKRPAYVPSDAPPEGMGPAQAVHLLGEPVNGRVYVATLLHAASLGAVALRGDTDGDWVLAARAQTEVRADTVTESALAPLLEIGDPFRVSRGSVDAGRALHAAMSQVRSETRAWGVRSGLMARTGVAGGCALLLAAGVILVVVCLVWQPFGMSMLGVLPGVLVVGAVSMAFSGAGTRHTRRGRELWSRVGGFKWVLQAPASRHRFDFSGREDIYADYVPWAVAFGCMNEWAQKYRTEVGAEPPVPAFLGAYDGEHTADYVTASIHRLSSAVSDAIATFEADRARPRRR